MKDCVSVIIFRILVCVWGGFEEGEEEVPEPMEFYYEIII